jgi:peptidoglycan/xylan/chitin deacetylase (PgdA/CDA1 family)
MSLWSKNRPQDFWRVARDIPESVWTAAIKNAAPILNIPELDGSQDIEKILEYTLGEGQFGELHWELSFAKRQYYMVKPLIPRALTRLMRQVYSGGTKKAFRLGWPVEDRYARFLWETLRQVMLMMGLEKAPFLYFWPRGNRAALVLTHDIETGHGQAYVKAVADIEASLGFHSSFNFIPERYPLDKPLMQWLRDHGFEIGIHGLKHDGKEFFDKRTFLDRVKKINQYINEFDALGFRAPLTHRNPEWMQELDIAYDASFFDTDPYEPIAGGVMTIWPYILGHFIELPYTLVQDYSLFNLLDEKSPRIWLEKVDFIQKYHGMILINTHPDYLLNSEHLQIYIELLEAIKKMSGIWRVLPAEIAGWWRKRTNIDGLSHKPDCHIASARIDNQNVIVEDW